MLKKSAVVLALCSSFAASAQTHYVWQHNDVKGAWQQGYLGQGTTIHIHDEFTNRNVREISGARNSYEGWVWSVYMHRRVTHGDAVGTVASRTAPLADIESRQWNDGNVTLRANRLNIVNASYGLMQSGRVSAPTIDFFRQNNQLAQFAHQGAALVVKAAGNSNLPLSDNGGGGDVLNLALKGAPAVIFAGALNGHGTPVTTLRFRRWAFTIGGTTKADYSNTPGGDPDFYNRFLMVGVPNSMNVAGTSFAAPQISAYAAIVGSKFTRAEPEAVANQLLSTARQDTIRGYHPHIHGRGEASLSRALSPSSIR
jgi:hypothetical protein